MAYCVACEVIGFGEDQMCSECGLCLECCDCYEPDGSPTDDFDEDEEDFTAA